MPAPTNPTELTEGQPAIVGPTTVSPGTTVQLNPAFMWTLFHTGRDANGAEDRSPCSFSVSETELIFDKGEGMQILPAGGEYTLPKGSPRVTILAAAGAPLLNIVSDKGQ